MPGGSVNGRPFREDPTSFEKTGIPRGNPQRYLSRGVIRMAPDSRQYQKQQLGEAPEGLIETEGDRQLKELLHKQLDTNVTTQQHIKRKKDFTSATVYKPLTAQTSGELSLRNYQDLSDYDQQVEQLRQCGLTEEEIHLKLQEDDHYHVAQPKKRSKFQANPGITEEKLAAINQKIQEKEEQLKKPDVFSGTKYMSRHELDLERAITHDEDKSRMLGCLVTSVNPDSAYADPKHPMNKIDGILNQVSKGRKHVKVKQVKEQELPTEESCPGCEVPPVCSECASRQEEERRQQEALKPLPIVQEHEILQNRLTVDKMKEHPQFKDHNPGKPNKVLYVKNLHASVTKKHLDSLFSRFQTSSDKPVQCRLLTGRMRRQAFISLPDVTMATSALQLLNGYQLNGKPIVILYSNKPTP